MASLKKVRAFDLFCGGGGCSIGAMQAGATPVGGADMWPVATDAFQLNFKSARTYTQNLLELDPHEVAVDVHRIDLLLASPECTHHSVAKGNKPRSEESKQLAFQVIRYAEVLKPRWIVVENVIQMERWEPFQEWLEELRRLDYNPLVLTLNADRFGVPQTRRRLFVICDRDAVPIAPRQSKIATKCVEDVICRSQTLGDWSYQFTPLENSRRAQSTIARARRAIESVGDKSEFIMVYYGSDGAGGFQTLDRPLGTITTIDRFALVRPNCVGHEMRMLQPSELALAMGFPAGSHLEATQCDCIKLVGNTDPVLSMSILSEVTSFARDFQCARVLSNGHAKNTFLLSTSTAKSHLGRSICEIRGSSNWQNYSAAA